MLNRFLSKQPVDVKSLYTPIFSAKIGTMQVKYAAKPHNIV